MVAPMMLAGKRAVEYESSFADVKKVVNFKDEKESAEYRTEMMKLAGDLGMRQEGIAQIVTAAGQSGIEKTELLKFAESATKMSVAWDVSAEEAGSTLATWRAAMGLTQDHALDLADSTNYLSNNMNAKAKDIAAVMVRQGSTAIGAGLSYNQTAALSASLIAGGAAEDVAATALKNITGRLTSGYAATSAQKEAMGKLGFNADELASMMQEDAQGTLVQVMRQLQDVDKAERGAVISQLFGEEVKGAVAKLVTTLDDDKNGLIAAFSRVEKQADRANSVNEEYENRAKTRGHTLSQLSAKFDRMMVVLGDRLLPVIDAVVPPLMTVVDGVSNFAEANPKLASGLLAVAGAIAIVKAGAIAFKLTKLTLGNGIDRLRLGREQLSGVTNNTALNARKATNELSRLNRELNSVGSSRGRSSGYEPSRRGRTRSPGSRIGRLVGGFSDLFGGLPAQPLVGKGDPERRSGSKRNRMAAFLSGGPALSVMSANSNVGELVMAGSANNLFNTLPNGSLLSGAGQLFRPLGIALSGAALTSAIASGDGQQIGGTAGDMIGGLGGAAAGAMAGAAIGSVVPVVGTAVGGVIGSVVGGFGGGELGRRVGESVGAWFSGDDESLAKQESKLTQPTGMTEQGKVGPTLSGKKVSNESELSIVNSLGSTASGVIAGATIGSVMPVIGTVMGGVIGSAVGVATGSGSWISEHVQNWFGDNKTDKPVPGPVIEQSKQLRNSNQQFNFAPVIQIQPSGNPEYDKGVEDRLIERMKAELLPVMMYSDLDVAVRADASLADRRDT
nr:phage tail tape measure protein [Pseudoalteromonas sp. Of7M-16]